MTASVPDVAQISAPAEAAPPAVRGGRRKDSPGRHPASAASEPAVSAGGGLGAPQGGAPDALSGLLARAVRDRAAEPGERGYAGIDSFKTKPTSGGLTGISLDVTFTVSDTPADGLQVIQTFMGTRRSDKVQVGTYTWIYEKKRWDAFVDGGVNSPFVTMSGEDPAHPTNPYYLTAAEVAGQVTWDTDHGTIRVTDVPGAVALHDEAYFETAIVAINYKGKGRDKVLRVFRWGWKGKGTKSTIGKGTKIDGADSGILVRSSVTPEFRNIVKHDYPKYRFD